MKRAQLVFMLIAFVLSGFHGQPAVADSNGLNEMLVVHLEKSAISGRRNRLVFGGLLIGSGALCGIGGGLTLLSPSSDPAMRAMIGYTLLGLGSATAGLGIATVLVPSWEERTYDRYQRSDDQGEPANLERAELLFSDLVRRKKQLRYIWGGISLAAGIGYIALSGYWPGALLAGVGLSQILMKSAPEREWELYLKEKEAHGAPQ